MYNNDEPNILGINNLIYNPSCVDQKVLTDDVVYVKEVTDFASFADFAGDNLNKENPFIPSYVYNNLPEILKQGASVYTDLRQKDVFLTGALGVLSGCMSSISGIYGDHISFANLFTFVSAPAASGKGSLVYAKAYGNNLHNKLKASTVVGKSKKILFIPGNASSAALIGHLSENDGRGIFFETEADTLSATFKNEWGNFSDLLRKGFHHESVSYSRKANNEFISIENPQLSVVLSGTPNQVKGLISSSENGLFSRILFYSFQSPLKWNDMSPNGNSNNIPAHFKEIEQGSGEIISKLNEHEVINYTLTAAQWKILNEVQERDLHTAVGIFGDNIVSVIKRTGIMLFRISMILSAIRSYDKIDKSTGLICTDLDFDLAKQLMDVYKVHIMSVYLSLPQNGETSTKKSFNGFYEALPNTEFQRKEAVAIGSELKIGERNVGTFLQILLSKNKLTNPRYGYYIKTKQTLFNKLQSLQSAK
jgi:hypothetical protein